MGRTEEFIVAHSCQLLDTSARVTTGTDTNACDIDPQYML